MQEIATQCPPHTFRGIEGKCLHCGITKGTTIDVTDWVKRTLATPYQCDRKGCRKPLQTMEVMYQHGRVFLCEECHHEALRQRDVGLPIEAANHCIVCGEPIEVGVLTCGDGRSRCARTLRKRSERQADNSD